MSVLFRSEQKPRISPADRLRAYGEVLISLAAAGAGVLMVADDDGSVIDRLFIGCPPPLGGAVASELELLARQAPDGDCAFAGLPPCHPVVERLLGEPPAGFVHSVIGRIRSRHGLSLIIVAGWRARAPEPHELAVLSRSSAVCRDAVVESVEAAEFGRAEATDNPALELINSISSPVFRLDERLTVVSCNEAGRRELDHGAVLSAHGGRLMSAASHGLEELRTAVRRSLRDTSQQGRRSSIVPLATNGGLPRFAIVAPSPVHGDDPTSLVVLPVVDSEEGARRLSTLYNLTPAEAKVVRLVLTGASPAAISAELSLTEATVRTYLKRIMLKLGINRRSEFFLLYILTMSPFRFGCEPPEVSEVARGPRAAGLGR